MNKPTIKEIEMFLREVDKLFPVALSQKQDLTVLSEKLYDKADVFVVREDDKIVSMVAGYTENLSDNIAYISIVATRPDFQGKGYAAKLIKEFIVLAKQKNIPAIHLYTASKSIAGMYYKLGFKDYTIINEPRPQDIHLIYRFEEEK
jgi:N-acetylglutamate synthase-like GNAT family acetyltransferase